MDLTQKIVKLNEIGIALSHERDVEKLLTTILTEAKNLTGADAGTLYLKEGDELVAVVAQTDSLSMRANPPVFHTFRFKIDKKRIARPTRSAGLALHAGWGGIRGWLYQSVPGPHLLRLMVIASLSRPS